MEQILIQQFIDDYFSLDQRIDEGIAYVVESQWYKDFQTFIENCFDDPQFKIKKLNNSSLIDKNQIETQFYYDELELPTTIEIKETKANRLNSLHSHQTDFQIVNQNVWQFLKKYFDSDIDVEIIVFATKQSQAIKKFVQFETLMPNLIVPLEFINITVAVLKPGERNVFHVIYTPIVISMCLDAFHKYIMDIIKVQTTWEYWQNADIYMYYDNKKITMKGKKTLEKYGFRNSLTLVVAQLDLQFKEPFNRIEEEQETQDEEMIEIDSKLLFLLLIIFFFFFLLDAEERENFKKLIEDALRAAQYKLSIKSVEEIKKSLDELINYTN